MIGELVDRPPGDPAVSLVVACGVAAAVGLCIGLGMWTLATVMLAAALLLVGALWQFRWLVLVWLAGMPTVFVFPNKVLYPIATVLTVERVLFAVLAGSVLAGLLVKRLQPGPLSPVERAMALALMVCLGSWLSTATRKPPAALYEGMVLWVEGLLIPFAAFALARHRTWADRELTGLFRILFGVGVYLGVAGLLQYHAGVTLFLPTYVRLDPHIDRATGSFPSPVEYGAVLGLLLLVALLQYAHARDGVGRLILLAGMAVMAAAVSASRTRAVWIAVAAALTVIWVRERRIRGPVTAGAFLAAVWLTVTSLLAGQDLRIEARIIEAEPLYNRIALSTTALNAIAHNPVLGLGWGPRSFAEEKSHYFASFAGVSPQWAANPLVPHNELLFVLVLTGVVGAVPYLLVFVRAYRLTREREADRGDGGSELRRRLAVSVRTMFVIVAVVGFASDIMFYTYFRVLFFFLLGIVAAPERHV